jgi:hypothetical protein
MTTIRTLLASAALVFAIVACSTAPATSPSPSPLLVTRPEQAIAQVIAKEPRLGGIGPLEPDRIGQAAWYEVQPASGVGAFVVVVAIGWGDCESGCIDSHRIVYAVAPDGTVSIVSEAGPPIPADAWPNATGTGSGQTGIGGVATAGPVCPVEKVPPDPACAPRPVAHATLVVRDGSGGEVARVATAADGSFFVAVPAGTYVVEPKPVDGLMGTAPPQDVTVGAGVTATITVVYDTGIR